MQLQSKILMIDIIVDTREQKPFLFKSYGDVRVIRQKVDTGDYVCPSIEHIVTIDRKDSTSELYENFTSDFKRFTKELERMRSIEFCYFVCSFPYSYLQEFPKNSTIPYYRWKLLRGNAAFMRKRVRETEEQYPNIKFIFCANDIEAEGAVYQILKEHSKNGPQT